MRTSSRECLPAGSNVSGKRPGRQETEVPKEWSNAIAVTTRFLVVNANWLQLSGATRQTCRFTIAITCGLNCKSDDSRGSPIPACMRSHPGDGSLRLRPGGGRRIGPEGRNLPFWRWAIYRGTTLRARGVWSLFQRLLLACYGSLARRTADSAVSAGSQFVLGDSTFSCAGDGFEGEALCPLVAAAVSPTDALSNACTFSDLYLASLT